MRPTLHSFGPLLLFTLAGAARAAPQDPQSVEARFEALAKKRPVVVVQLSEAKADAHAGPIEASADRGIMPPSVLSPKDVVQVFSEHKKELAGCLKSQRDKNKSFSAKVILDVAIKRTGRVAELRIAPASLSKEPLGRCVLRAVPKWKFPSFTGEIDNGVSQEVVNASVPISFAPGS